MIVAGDIIRVNYNDGSVFSGCLMEVDEVRPWGVKCNMQTPGKEGGTAFYRAATGSFVVVARVMAEDELRAIGELLKKRPDNGTAGCLLSDVLEAELERVDALLDDRPRPVLSTMLGIALAAACVGLAAFMRWMTR